MGNYCICQYLSIQPIHLQILTLLFAQPQLEAALCEKKELAKTKIMALKENNCQQREKLERLRCKYLALIQLYNKFAEDCEKPENLKEASDSSCSEDNDDCEGWCKDNLD